MTDFEGLHGKRFHVRTTPTGEVVLSTDETAVAFASDEAWRLGHEIINQSYAGPEGPIH